MDGDVELTAAFHHREDGGDLRPGFLAAQVQSVFPADRYGAHRVLGQVGTQVEFRMLQGHRQLAPERQCAIGQEK